MVWAIEAPDDETATAAPLAISSQRNIRTKTMCAFSRDETCGVIDKVP